MLVATFLPSFPPMSRETGFEPDILFDTKVSARDSDGLVPLGLAVLGPTGFATYPLTAGQPRVVGRDPQADIVVDDPSVSRRHARVYVGDVIEIEDLGSSNGTFVKVIGSEHFANGEVLLMGQQLFRVTV